MKQKGLMKLGGIAIAAVFLVLIIVLNLKPVSPGDSTCVIRPTLQQYDFAYAKACGTQVQRCRIFVDKNGDGDYGEWVLKGNKWKFQWDEDERPGVAGCECAERACTDWCQNDVCNWNEKIKVSRSVCRVTSSMPHCTGAVFCPTEGGGFESCDGEECGSIPAGGCCLDNIDCATYYDGGPNKCVTVIDVSNDCYSWEGYYEDAPYLTENPGKACLCANLNEPCGTSLDCCDDNHDGMPDYMCCDSVCKTECVAQGPTP